MSANDQYYKDTVYHLSDVLDPATGVVQRQTPYNYVGQRNEKVLEEISNQMNTLPVPLFEPLLPRPVSWLPTEIQQPYDDQRAFRNFQFSNKGFYTRSTNCCGQGTQYL